MDIGGKLSESIFAASSNCYVLIINSVAIALVSPVDGNPLIINPPSILIDDVSLMLITFVIAIIEINLL